MVSPFDKYENIPGVKVEYENGNLYSEQANLNADTKSVLLVGSAVDGPVGEVVSVRAIGGPKAAEKLFGGMLERVKVETGEVNPDTGEPIMRTVKEPHQGSLIRGMYEALAAGNEDVRLLRISGNTAKTELPAQDVNKDLEQVLGVASGNIAFSEVIGITGDSRLSNNPIQSIREKNSEGQIIKEYSGATAINNVVLSVDTSKGNETVFFKKNVLRPGNKAEVKYSVNNRTYHEVLRSDPDGKLIQDHSATNYFASEHRFFSDDIEKGHTYNVFVDGFAVNQVNSAGEWLWRVGKEDDSVEDPLRDLYTKKEYEQGGIRFTEAYMKAVEEEGYDELTSSVVVEADYFYYDEVATTLTEEYVIKGESTTYELNYTPDDNVKAFYEIGDEVFELKPITEGNPDGDYSMVYPSTHSERTKVVVKPGVVP